MIFLADDATNPHRPAAAIRARFHGSAWPPMIEWLVQLVPRSALNRQVRSQHLDSPSGAPRAIGLFAIVRPRRGMKRLGRAWDAVGNRRLSPSDSRLAFSAGGDAQAHCRPGKCAAPLPAALRSLLFSLPLALVVRCLGLGCGGILVVRGYLTLGLIVATTPSEAVRRSGATHASMSAWRAGAAGASMGLKAAGLGFLSCAVAKGMVRHWMEWIHLKR